MFRCRRQRGAALIIALLAVALATVSAVALTSRQHFDIRRTANILLVDQAWLYALGAESLAHKVLERDARESETGHLGEMWAMVMPPLPIEGGSVQGRLHDLSGRFNLNSVVDGQGQGDTYGFEQFRRLLVSLDLDPALADALLDWIDSDDEVTFPGGAEEAWYLSREPPYRVANRPLVSVSELRLVRGFDNDVMMVLAPYVAALPVDTALNINTAPARVLASLADQLQLDELERWVAQRDESDGFDSVESFMQQPPFVGEAGDQMDQQRLAVRSEYFLFEASVTLAELSVRLYAVLERRGGEAYTRLRGMGAY